MSEPALHEEEEEVETGEVQVDYKQMEDPFSEPVKGQMQVIVVVLDSGWGLSNKQDVAAVTSHIMAYALYDLKRNSHDHLVEKWLGKKEPGFLVVPLAVVHRQGRRQDFAR